MQAVKMLAVIAVLASVIIWSTGCAVKSPYEPPQTVIYAKYKAPVSIGTKGDLGSKVGKEVVKTYFSLVSVGDNSVKTAAENAGIKKIKHIGYEWENILFIYQETTIVVYGD